MISKYAILAILSLLVLSSVPVAFATNPVLSCVTNGACSIDTHGPRATSITFAVTGTDAGLFGSLVGGTIQAAEWTLSVSSYGSLPNGEPNGCGLVGGSPSGNCEEGIQTGYTTEGIAFNTLRPYVNSYDFRLAIEYLTDYLTLGSNVLSGIAGSASPYWLPCTLYPNYCYDIGAPAYNLVSAENALIAAGLVAYNSATSTWYCSATIYGTAAPFHPTVDPKCTINTTYSITKLDSGLGGGFTSLVSSLTWYRHENPSKSNGKAGTSTYGKNCAVPVSTWTSTTQSDCTYSPNFLYRIDDPLRSGGALQIKTAASLIGLTINAIGITDAQAGSRIYGASEAAFIYGGSAVPKEVNGSNPSTVPDGWDMYTYGWVLNAYGPVDSFFFFASYFRGLSLNFGEFNNATVTGDTYALFTATTTGAAQTEASAVGLDVLGSLPYLPWWYEATLWAVNTGGWAGFANVPSTGPDTSSGIYFTSLNAYSTANGLGFGGNLQYALHSVADPSGMTPIYNTNWVWQADVWSELYDSPLGTAPNSIQDINSFINWMTTSYSAVPFSGATPSGAGVSDFNTSVTTSVFNGHTCHSVTQKGCAVPNDLGFTVTNGEEVSFTFRNNMTFSDNSPITAADYNASLFAWDLAGQTWTPNLDTPDTGELAGIIVSDQVVGNTIHIYLSNDAVWNLADTIVPVLSANLFKYVNLDWAATSKGTIDFTKTYAAAVAGCTWHSCKTGNKAPEWLVNLPNLEITSGPYSLKTYNGITGAGVMSADINYQRTAWTVNATRFTYSSAETSINIVPSVGDNAHTASVTLVPVAEYTYNGATNTHVKAALTGLGVSHGNYGYIDIPGANMTGTTVTVLTASGGATSATGSVTCNIHGQCSGSINVSSLSNGEYEVVFSTNFTYLGLARTWYEFTGFTLTAQP